MRDDNHNDSHSDNGKYCDYEWWVYGFPFI